MYHLKVLFLVGTVLGTSSSANIDFSKLKCQGQSLPAHGQLKCEDVPNSQDVYCVLSCDLGYDVEFLAAERYVCHTDGTWTAEPATVDTKWPDCKKYTRGEPVP